MQIAKNVMTAGIGIVAGATVSIIVSSIFRRSYPSPAFDVNEVLSQPREADYVWRIIFMFGAVPAAVTFYYRMQMPETARYTALVVGNNRRAAQDMGRVLQVSFPSIIDNPVEQGRGTHHPNPPTYHALSSQLVTQTRIVKLQCASTG